MADARWKGKEVEIAREAMAAWEAGEEDDAVLDRLCAVGLDRPLAARALDTVASACSTASLLHIGLRPDQVSSDQDDDPLFIAALKQAVGELEGDEPAELRSLAELAKALQGEDAYDRQDAVYELGETGKRQAVGLLISALDDEDLWVRVYAVQALAQLGSFSATGPLSDLVASSGDGPVVRNAIKALGRIGDPAALPALVAATRHEDPFARYDALNVLGDMGDPEAIPAVEALLKDDTRPVERDEDGMTTMETADRICDRARKILKRLRAKA